MKPLTRNELKNVKGGLQTLPPGCYCHPAPDGSLPGGDIDPFCNIETNSGLYCAPGQVLVCC